jgi:hypothetical protein
MQPRRVATMQKNEPTTQKGSALRPPEAASGNIGHEFDAQMRLLFGNDYRKEGEGRRWWPKGRGV